MLSIEQQRHERMLGSSSIEKDVQMEERKHVAETET